MPKLRISFALLMSFAALAAAASSFAQGRPDPAITIAAQKTAMAQLKFMDGIWRGPAWTVLPSGARHDVTQTERIGPLLDGSLKLLEGRAYNADGTTGFNALGVVSYDPKAKTFNLHSYAQGMSGDFALVPTKDGYAWEIPLGPMTIRYTATITDSTWHEVGDRMMGEQDPVRFFDMDLKRVSDSPWPGDGAVPPQ